MRRVIIESVPNNVYQQGGLTNADMLTGNYAAPSKNPNIEVEGGEHTLNSQTGQVQEVAGKKHINGGEKINLPDQSKVLSDYTKIGAKNVKVFEEMFDINLKATDTFATVLDKFNRKIGVKTLEEEEKELLKKLEKNTKSSIDRSTKKINEDFLAQEIAEINQKKASLNKLKQHAFETIFQEQEKIPKKGDGSQILDKSGNPIKQEGGEQQGQPDPQQIIQAFAQMSGQDPQQIVQQLQQLPPDKQQAAIGQMLQALQQGQGEQAAPEGEQPQMRYGGMYEELPKHQYTGEVAGDPVKTITNAYADPSQWILQHPAKIGYGQNLGAKPIETLAEVQRVLPRLHKTYLAGHDSFSPEIGSAYQGAYNKHTDEVLSDAERLYGKDSEQYKNLSKQVAENRFTPLEMKDGKNINVRGLDSKIGDYTTTRPNFALSVIPREELAKLNKEGINTASQLQEKNPELFNKYVGDKNLTSDFWLGAVDPTKEAEPEQPIEEAPGTVPRDVVKNIIYDKGMPYVMPPSAPIAPYLQQVDLSRLESRKGSVENQLQASENARQAAYAATKGLPPAQAAAMMASYLSTSGQQDVQGIANQEVQDIGDRTRVEQYNAGQLDKEKILNDQLKKQYEREAFGTLNVNEQNWRNYYDTNDANRKAISDEIERRNIMNLGLDNYQLNGSGGFDFVNKSKFQGADPAIMAYTKWFNTLTPEQQLAERKRKYEVESQKIAAATTGDVISPRKA